MQKGSTLGIILAAFGVLVLVMWGGYYFFKEDQGPAPVIIQDSERAAQEEKKATRSFVVFDSNFSYSNGSVYYRSGSDASGAPVYTLLPVAEPESFQKIATVSGSSDTDAYAGFGRDTYAQSSYFPGQVGLSGGNQQESNTTQLGSASGSGGGYSVSYYTDGENVYVVVSSGGNTGTPQIVPGADPDTFEVLNSEYSSDGEHVYVIVVTCVGTSCSASVSVVGGADPDTFQPYPNQQQVMNADCTAYVLADAQDNRYLYNNGQVIEGISVYLIGSGGDCDNTPVLISP